MYKNSSKIFRLKINAILVLIAVIVIPVKANAESISFNIKDSVGTDKFVVMDSGKMGIGTNAPLSVIHIEGLKQTASQIKVMTKDTAGVDSGGGIGLGHNNVGANNSYAFPYANDRIGYLLMGTYDSGANLNRWGGGITANAAADWSVDTVAHLPTNLSFTTADMSGPHTTRMIILYNGRVGIGTQTPAQQLEVNGGIRINTANAKPTCNSSIRGTFWVTKSAAGVEDIVQVCIKKADDAYVWRTL